MPKDGRSVFECAFLSLVFLEAQGALAIGMNVSLVGSHLLFLTIRTRVFLPCNPLSFPGDDELLPKPLLPGCLPIIEIRDGAVLEGIEFILITIIVEMVHVLPRAWLAGRRRTSGVVWR